MKFHVRFHLCSSLYTIYVRGLHKVDLGLMIGSCKGCKGFMKDPCRTLK